jgi:hypothetical protein
MKNQAILNFEKHHERPKNTQLNNVEHLITFSLLKNIYLQLRTTNEIKIDPSILKQYEDHLDQNLIGLTQRIRSGNYKPQSIHPFIDAKKIHCSLSAVRYLEDQLAKTASRMILYKTYSNYCS